MSKLNPKWCPQMGRDHQLADLKYRPKLINGGMYCRHCDKRVKMEDK